MTGLFKLNWQDSSSLKDLVSKNKVEKWRSKIPGIDYWPSLVYTKVGTPLITWNLTHTHTQSITPTHISHTPHQIHTQQPSGI